MKSSLFFLSCALLIVGGSPAHAQEAQSVASARAAASAWLATVDSGRYGHSWDQGAVLFQTSVTKDQWQHAMETARSPLGELKTRTLKSATFARSLPGAPDGEYVVVRFETDFANKAGAVETVTPMHEKDGSWKVSGYYIK